MGMTDTRPRGDWYRLLPNLRFRLVYAHGALGGGLDGIEWEILL